MKISRISNFKKKPRAFALPMVLWAIAFLTALILMVAGSVNNWLKEESHAERVFRARQMALSGLAIAMNTNISPNDPILTKGDPKSKEGESYWVQVTSESGLINPNLWLQKPDHRTPFQVLFGHWNISEEDQESAIDGLYDWQSATPLRSPHGAKADNYEALGLEGYPPNAPFVDAREMAMVIGFAPVMKAQPKWKNYFSTYNPGTININVCDKDILTDFLGITPDQADAFIKLRKGPPNAAPSLTNNGLSITNLLEAEQVIGLSPTQNNILLNYFGISGNVRHIDSIGTCNGVVHHIIVIMAGIGNNILSWQEE
ncbi:MAG: general secretion pathway protein GspK [Chthoniobacterales bacterium]